MAFLFPTILVGCMAGEELGSGSIHNTKEFGKWSKDHASVAIDFDYVDYVEDRRSLQITHTGTSDMNIIRGGPKEVGDPDDEYDDTCINNPFGDSPSDPSFVTNVGMYLYVTDSKLSTFTTFSAKIAGAYITDSEGILKNPQDDVLGQWIWTDVVLSNISSQSAMELFYFLLNPGGNSGQILINNINLFKRSASNAPVPTYYGSSSNNPATNEYNWQNGIKFIATEFESDDDQFKVSGFIYGKRLNEVWAQLKSFKTIDLNIHKILERPFPKVSTINDYYNIKTYLLYIDIINENTGEIRKVREPVVVTDIKLSKPKRKTRKIEFQLTLIKFSGV